MAPMTSDNLDDSNSSDVIIEPTKSSPAPHKATSKGPLKSIMKKRDKGPRKDLSGEVCGGGAKRDRSSHLKDFLDLRSSRSPSHSVSMSGMASVADTNQIQLNVIRQSLDGDMKAASNDGSDGRHDGDIDDAADNNYVDVDRDDSVDGGAENGVTNFNSDVNIVNESSPSANATKL